MCSYYHEGQKPSSYNPKFKDLNIAAITVKGFTNVLSLKLPKGKKGNVTFVNIENTGNWVMLKCPKCDKDVIFWNGGKRKIHKHHGCGGIVEN